MEPVSNVEKKWRTRQEKDELIALWKQSGKSRKLFCIDQGLNYNSFVSWHQQHKAKAKSETGFSQVIVQSGEKIFAQLHLPGEIRIDLYQPLSAEFIRALLK